MDTQLVQREAHTLKASAGMVGALRLATLAGALEADLKGGSAAPLERLTDQMRAEFELVRAELIVLVEAKRGLACPAA
jgi:HPt (histidine-containing phosphotransfer) domain-containing protein